MIDAQGLDRLTAAVAQLPEPLAEVLRLRYGLGGGEPMGLREIGDLRGLSRERIRQLEQKGLQQLRRRRSWLGRALGEFDLRDVGE